MSACFDLRGYKKALRVRFRGIRKSFQPPVKAEKDNRILKRLLDMPAYHHCRLLLTYVSTAEEVDTRALIARALADGKAVAVPHCVDGTRRMDFYRIQSLGELVPRTFGVLEPVAREENRVTGYAAALCVLPGVAFDRFGYRLGYGGGYYDRFLSQEYTGKTVGVCYRDCTLYRLKHGRFDVSCDYIVTEQGCRRALRDASAIKEPAPGHKARDR